MFFERILQKIAAWNLSGEKAAAVSTACYRVYSLYMEISLQIQLFVKRKSISAWRSPLERWGKEGILARVFSAAGFCMYWSIQLRLRLSATAVRSGPSMPPSPWNRWQFIQPCRWKSVRPLSAQPEKRSPVKRIQPEAKTSDLNLLCLLIMQQSTGW